MHADCLWNCLVFLRVVHYIGFDLEVLIVVYRCLFCTSHHLKTDYISGVQSTLSLVLLRDWSLSLWVPLADFSFAFDLSDFSVSVSFLQQYCQWEQAETIRIDWYLPNCVAIKTWLSLGIAWIGSDMSQFECW